MSELLPHQETNDPAPTGQAQVVRREPPIPVPQAANDGIRPRPSDRRPIDRGTSLTAAGEYPLLRTVPLTWPLVNHLAIGDRCVLP